MATGKRRRWLLIGPIFFTLLCIHLPAAQRVWHDSPAGRALDQATFSYLNHSLAKAAASFTAARGLNAIISVVQESQVQATILGTGVTLAVGQALDPVNDLIERFSWVMLVSMTSLGVQRFALELGPWLSLRLLVTLGMLCFLAALWRPGNMAPALTRWGMKLTACGLLVAFLVPLAALANQGVYRHFLEENYNQAMERLDDEALKGGELRSKEVFSTLEKLKAKMTQYAEDLVELIVVFVVQTLVLPLLTAWIFIRAVKGVVSWGGSRHWLGPQAESGQRAQL